MNKRLNDLGISVDLKFDTKKIKTRTAEILDANHAKGRIIMKYRKTKITLIAAALTIVCIGTVFAAGSVISYFNSDKAARVTNVAELERHNESIEASVSKYGYTLTLDNLAVDDNFLHIFYTITSQEGKIWENLAIDPFVICRVNGQIVGNDNNNDMHGYYVDDYTYKTVLKYNIAATDIPDNFMFEMYSVPRVDECSKYNDDYLCREALTLTDDDKEKLMYISVNTKKSTIQAENVSYNINKEFTYTDYLSGNDAVGAIKKVVFSPFGSQLVIHDSSFGTGAEEIMGMAMMDDNNNFLDILATDIGKSGEASMEQDNSIEFIKGTSGMKGFTLIPVIENSGKTSEITHKIGSYPLTYEINEYGKVVVTGISVKDGRIDVHYYKEGFVRHNPEFIFLESNGSSIEFGEIPAVYYETHYDTNSYTASYYYDDYDENGKKALPSDGSLSRETLEKRFVSLKVRTDNDYTLDYDNAIKVNLQ